MEMAMDAMVSDVAGAANGVELYVRGGRQFDGVADVPVFLGARRLSGTGHLKNRKAFQGSRNANHDD